MPTQRLIKLRWKILAGFGAVVFVFLAAAGVFVGYSFDNVKLIGRIKSESLAETRAFTELRFDILAIQQLLSYTAASGNAVGADEAQRKYDGAVQTINEILKSYAATDGALKASLEALKVELEDFMILGTQMIGAYLGAGPEIGNIMMDSFNPIAEQMMADLSRLVQDRNLSIDRDFENLAAHSRDTILYAILAVALSVAIALGVAFALSGTMSRSINKMVDLTEEVKNGRLSKSIELRSKDELGRLASNLNAAVGSVRNLVGNIKIIAKENHKGSNELSQAMARASEDARQVAKAIQNVTCLFDSVITDLNDAIDELGTVFSNISQLSTRVEKQSEALTESTAAVQEMTASLHNVDRIIETKKNLSYELRDITADGGRKIQASSASISAVATNLESIASMIGMIKSVSSQTNLLAMNASIEAAHAGSYGLGFAVVADEIRKLAESTSRSTKDISKSLKELMNDIQLVMSSGEASGESFRKIDSEVALVVSAFDEIRLSSSELAIGGGDIQAAMTEILNQAEGIRRETVDIDEAATEIRRSLTDVKTLSGQASAEIKNIDANTVAMSEVLYQVSALVSASNSEVENLNRQIEFFTLEETV